MATAIVTYPLAPSFSFLVNENTEAYAEAESEEDPDTGIPDSDLGGVSVMDVKEYPEYGIKVKNLYVSLLPGKNAKELIPKKIEESFLNEFFNEHRYEFKNRKSMKGIDFDLYKEDGVIYTKEELRKYAEKVKKEYPILKEADILSEEGYFIADIIGLSDKLVEDRNNELIYARRFKDEDFTKYSNATRGDRYEDSSKAYSYYPVEGIYGLDRTKVDIIIGERSKPDLTETKSGVYKVKLKGLSEGFRNGYSMAHNAIEDEGYVVINENEKRLYVKFKPMDLMGQHGHLMDAFCYKGLETEGEEPEAVKVEEVYKDGSYERYPGWISMKLENNDTTNSISCYKDIVVNVDVMIKSDGTFDTQIFTIEADYSRENMIKENSTAVQIKEFAEEVKKLDPEEYTAGVDELDAVADESVKTADDGEASQEDLNKAMANLIIAKSNLADLKRKEQLAPKNIEGVAPTSKDGRDGKLIGLNPDKSYEYKNVSDKEYKKVPEHASGITGLEAGKYDIRYARDKEFFESDSAWADVPEYKEKDKPALEKGVKYEVPVKLMKAYENAASMGNRALNPKAVIEEKDGYTNIYISVEGIDLMNMRGHLTRLRVYPDGVSSTDENLVDAEVSEYKKDKGLQEEEKEFPSVFKITRNKSQEDEIGVRVNVDAMDSMSQGRDGSQPARLIFDWEKAVKIQEEKPSENEKPGETEEPSDKDKPFEEKDENQIKKPEKDKNTSNTAAEAQGISELIKLGEQIKKKKNFSRYTDESANMLNDCLEAAKKIYEDESVSYYDLIEASVSLRFAISQMEYADRIRPKDIEASYKEYDSERVYINGYKDGTFKPEKKITRAEAAKVLAYALTDISEIEKSEKTSFSDIDKSAWYSDIVDFMASIDAVRGYGDGSFKPDKNITRAEFTAIISSINGYDSNSLNKFKDVPKDHWAKEYIEDAGEKNYVKGYPNGTFKPDETITRAEVVAMINRMIDKNVESFKDKNNLKIFSDVDENHWAYWEIAAATNK